MYKPFALLTVLICATFTIAAPPATQPVMPFGDDTVVVRQFQPVGPVTDSDWIAQAIQQSLVADLARGGALQAVAYAPKAGKDEQIASAEDGRFMILGNYQLIDSDLRITGVIWDLQSGQVIGGLKATGALRDLFTLEDSLSNAARSQILNVLNPKPTAPVQQTVATAAPAPQQINVTIQNSGPVRTYEGSDLSRAVENPNYAGVNYDNNYNRYYYYSQPAWYGYYPFYGYGYGWRNRYWGGWYNGWAWPGYTFVVNRGYYGGYRPYCR